VPTARPVPERKRRDRYHHGNLRQALVDQAVRTIRTEGVEALTLRDVAAALRVSRTALYRHFADKQSLLAALAAEGFRSFTAALAGAWNDGGRGRAGFLDMGRAYVRFAMANPSHYRVMFGGFVEKSACDPDLGKEAEGGYRVLVDALAELQNAELVQPGPTGHLAVFVWGSVHGLAMLWIDGQLAPHGGDAIDGLIENAVARVWASIDAEAPAPTSGSAPP